MGTRKPKEAIVIILDVGSSMRKFSVSGQTYLESSKYCISQIIQRKIFSQSHDELGLIVFNFNETNNKLASSDDEYNNISVISEHLAKAKWDLLQFVSEIENNEINTADWLSAVIVALQFIKDEEENKTFDNYKIVIFSNFENEVSDDQVDIIIAKLKNMNIDLVVIGPDLCKENVKSENSANSLKLINNIVNKIDGVICNFDDAYSELMHFQRKSVKPMPWDSILTISNKIKIAITAYKKTAETPPIKWITEVIDNETAGVIKERTYVNYTDQRLNVNSIDQKISTSLEGNRTDVSHGPKNETDFAVHRDGNTQKTVVKVPKNDVIEAYQFGSTIVPFSNTDKEAMTYKSDLKGLYFLGCVPKDQISIYMLVGNGCYIVTARKYDDISKVALEAFIEALHRNSKVGIAKRIYSNYSTVTIGGLIPVVTEDFRYLIFAELPFAEDEHVYKFQSFSKINPSQEQLNVVGNLIDHMDLDGTENKSELYDLTKIYDHHEQYVLRCLSHKVLYPNTPLPDEILESTKKKLQPLPEIIEHCRPILKCIKEKFQIKEIIKKSKKRKNFGNFDKENKNEEEKVDVSPNSGTNVENEEPVETNSNDTSYITNIEELFKPERSYSENVEEARKKVATLISSDFCDNIFIINILKKYRQNAYTNVQTYNYWIKDLKDQIVSNENNISLWKSIINENLGLITSIESSQSDIDLEAAEEFSKLKNGETVEDSYERTLTMDLILNEL